MDSPLRSPPIGSGLQDLFSMWPARISNSHHCRPRSSTNSLFFSTDLQLSPLPTASLTRLDLCSSLIGDLVFDFFGSQRCLMVAWVMGSRKGVKILLSCCISFKQWLPPSPARVYTDDEIAARVVIRDILNGHPIQSKNPKIAFMFLTPGSLPFEKLWEKFFLWFSMKRQHALLVMADSLYYLKFKHFCKPGMEGRNCYADEHYLPTLFHMVDPSGIANWSVTHVDWSEGKWHPKAYRAQDVTFELLRNITSIDVSFHVTSNEKKVLQQRPCLWNGVKRPCYLFARKFYPETLDKMMRYISNYTI
ncbi:hypothetical protein MRB53_013129 [Persea americana]|uniref:Uncharacterized protein n=1 Tax=Persea americana TaxID=3435 RepID=A0ACC2K749_PERAE|nr:hypothetical protein MRB53_013129 [Persea americana]